jgi:hypothetical protein
MKTVENAKMQDKTVEAQSLLHKTIDIAKHQAKSPGVPRSYE